VEEGRTKVPLAFVCELVIYFFIFIFYFRREEERNAREKEWLSKLFAKFKEIEKTVIEDFADR
jgi:hypothetical protein